MKRILVINPNTSEPITEMVLASCRQQHPGVLWQGVTARFGMGYIAGEVAYAIAAHAVLDAFATHMDGHDAVLIACFGDPGLLALRELAGVPVIGLAQASLQAAAEQGPFAVVTGGERWGPMLGAFARTHQLDAQLVTIRTITLTGAEIALDPDAALDSLAQACQATVDAGARSVVLGGAALVGLATKLQPRMGGITLFDNVQVGANAVVEAAHHPERHPSSGVMPIPAHGLSEALAQRLSNS
jgi:allantoin racemase